MVQKILLEILTGDPRRIGGCASEYLIPRVRRMGPQITAQLGVLQCIYMHSYKLERFVKGTGRSRRIVSRPAPIYLTWRSKKKLQAGKQPSSLVTAML